MNEVYMIEDEDGGLPLYRCECGWSTRRKHQARDHLVAVCEEPKGCSPSAGQVEESLMELDVFRRELSEALNAACREGVRVGYNDGLAVAYQMVSDAKLAAERQGANALLPVLQEMKNQLDGFVLLAHEMLPRED